MQIGTVVNDGSRCGIVVATDEHGYGIGWFSEVTRPTTDDAGSVSIGTGAGKTLPEPVAVPVPTPAGLYTEEDVQRRIAEANAATATVPVVPADSGEAKPGFFQRS